MGRLAIGLRRPRSIDGRNVLCREISRRQRPQRPYKASHVGKAGTITPDEARTLAKKTLGSVAHGADPAAQRAADKRASTLAEVAEQFLTEHVEAKRSASSAKSYRDLLERLAIPELGKRKAEKITTAEIQRLHSKHSRSPYQANRLLRVLSSLFSFAAKAHVVPIGFNPCRGIEISRKRAANDT